VNKKQHDIEVARQLLARIEKGVPRETGVFDWLLTQKRLSWLMVLGILISGLAIAFAFYQILTGYFPAPQAHLHRSIHVNILLILGFVLWPLGRKSWRDRFHFLTVIDIACILLVIIIQIWISYDVDAFVLKEGRLSVTDQVLTMLYLGLVLEVTRRTVGPALVLVVLFFLAHTLFTDLFPGVLYGPPTTVEWLAEMQVIQTYGLFGIPVMAMASYVSLFIIFAVLLINSGGGKFFIKMALALTGQQIGGPAKAAVVSSAMMGTISGSVIGNVVATGSFTIPLMKQTGYKAHFAGAVEACSSSGGMIMPPVMGVTAFVMAEFMGVPYIKVALAATIPAFLYFLSTFIQVHLEGVKTGLRPLPKEILPSVWQTLRNGWHLLIPLVVITGFLVVGFTVMMASFWGVVSIFFSTLLKKETRMEPLRLFSALEVSARTIAPVTAACASSGIIIGCIFSSGLGMRFSTLIIELAGNSLWLALVLTMLVSIVLGMGMTVTPVYITLAAMVVPSLIQGMNVYPMAAHMFCLYFGVKSHLTPPVALAAYAAAGIAGAPPMRTGNTAFRVGIAGFIVPFMFVYRPELLLHGTPAGILWTLVTSVLGIGCVAVAAEGWFLTDANVMERILLLVGSIAFIHPSIPSTVVGFAILGMVIGMQKVRMSRHREIISSDVKPRSSLRLFFRQTFSGKDGP
jgi:TRAP transporter 4TM/12TM fusion protein